MPLVLDSSVAASWGIPDEQSAIAHRAVEHASRNEIIVPSLFWHEVRNVFLISERRNRIVADETERGLSLVSAFGPTVDDSAVEIDILRLARLHGLTAYDAAYLELAMRTRSRLATLDRKLDRAATNEGVETFTES